MDCGGIGHGKTTHVEMSCEGHNHTKENYSENTKVLRQAVEKGRGSDDESGGAQLRKSKASVRKEVDSKEYHNVVEVDLPIVKKGTQM
ncbi:hypothetical protein B296_00036188 [Ensete ventricosum]|uniref:Uncharacterized protein n=1 Tax=Ensete ventricosum TaxID=4639 RepID=A0A426Y4J5_ENSVE|nr:hypothetical protein B296_00036188 [Ensete ventricosum]